MKNIIILSFIFLSLIGVCIHQQVEISRLQEEVNIVKNRQELNSKKYQVEATAFVQTVKNSIVSIKCQDKSNIQVKWIGTATKVADDYIATVFHLISPSSNTIQRTYPIECFGYHEGQQVGFFRVEDELQARKNQIGSRDLALIHIKFNTKGKEIPVTKPENLTNISVGDPVSLISAHAKFHLDPVVSFGVVLSKKVKNSLKEEFQSYWEGAVSSDVIAYGGSSGGALLFFGENKPKFIGIHVGNNGFSGLHQAHYQLLFDELFFEKYHSLH